MSPSERPQDPSDVTALRAVIEEARATVQGGGAVDLAGLDRWVADLCRALEAQDPPDTCAMLPALAALVADLDALAAALRAGSESGSAADRSRAAGAYRRPDEPERG